jgi:hypothetical protein
MAAPFKIYNQVVDLSPRLPLSAVVTVGRRDERGVPVMKDRFFIKSPDLEKQTFKRSRGKDYQADGRGLHPDFEAWNTWAESSRVVTTKAGRKLDFGVLQGIIMAPSIGDAFESSMWAKELPGLASPGGRYPHCTGDGQNASRFVRMQGNTPVYEDHPCPCPFAEGEDPACKIRAALYFIPSWGEGSKMPRCLTRWSTRSRQSAENALGMLEHARRVGIGMGIPEPSILGMPFEMRIAEGTSALRKTRFPVVHFSITADLPACFAAQKEQQAQLGAGGYVLGNALPQDERLALIAGDVAELAGAPPQVAGDPVAAALAAVEPEQVVDLEPVDHEPVDHLEGAGHKDLTDEEKAAILAEEAANATG